MDNLKPGDKVVVTWTDGERVECTFICEQNGFHIFEDKKGEKVTCRSQNTTIIKI